MTVEAMRQDLRIIVVKWKEVIDGERLEVVKAGKHLLWVYGGPAGV